MLSLICSALRCWAGWEEGAAAGLAPLPAVCLPLHCLAPLLAALRRRLGAAVMMTSSSLSHGGVAPPPVAWKHGLQPRRCLPLLPLPLRPLVAALVDSICPVAAAAVTQCAPLPVWQAPAGLAPPAAPVWLPSTPR